MQTRKLRTSTTSTTPALSLPDSFSEPERARWGQTPPPLPAGTPAVQAPTSPLAGWKPAASPSDSLSKSGAGRGEASRRPPLLWARSCALTDLLPPAVRAILKEEIGKRLARHFEAPQWNYPIWLTQDSEILWGKRAQMLHAGCALRGLRLRGWWGLYGTLLFDAERLARLVVERHPEHSLHERVMCILGTLRRIGQVYREMRWRCGERRALWHVRYVLSALHWW